MTNKKELDERKLLHKKILDEPNFWRRFKCYFSYLKALIFGGIGIIVALFIYSFFDKNIDYWTLLYTFLFFLAAFVYSIIVTETDVKHQQLDTSPREKQLTGMILYSFLFLGLVLWLTYSQVDSVKNKKIHSGIEIQFYDNSILISDGNDYYIGKTNNYLFYHHEKTGTTDVIPMSEIKKLTFKKYR